MRVHFEFALLPLSQVLAAATASAAVWTQATLPSYGVYNGLVLSRADLPRNVTAWLGVEYAEQPVGQLRYAPATPRAKVDELEEEEEEEEVVVEEFNATAYGHVCMQYPGASAGTMGEDCLSLNVFRPSDVPREELLPVAFYIHGGGFNVGSSQGSDMAAFVARAQYHRVMAVSINYRLGGFGFAASPAFADLGLLNLGFTDQVLALRFVRENIRHFGGDPDAVTLMGSSAGAHAVGYHYLNGGGGGGDGGGGDGGGGGRLFARATMHSGAPTSRAYPNASYPLYVHQFSTLVDGVGCDVGSSNELLLECLRAVDAETLNAVQSGMYSSPESQYFIEWPFQPVMGGPLIPRPAHESWSRGLFNRVPLLTGFCQNEGSIWVPQNLSTNNDFESWFQRLLPSLSAAHLRSLTSLYPSPPSPPGSNRTAADDLADSSEAGPAAYASQFTRAAAAYGDYAYACQTGASAIGATARGAVQHVWKYRFDQNDSFPPWEGIPHVGDAVFQWDGVASEAAAGDDARAVGRVYHQYLASFVATGDPNAWVGADKDLVWGRYGGEDAVGAVGRQLLLAHGAAVMEDDLMRRRQCEFWRSIPEELDH